MTTTPPVAGSSAGSPEAVGAGAVLDDRYELVREIGRGASATVFEANDRNLDRHVAIKVLHQGLSSDPSFIDRFRNESKAAAALNHPQVMAVHDWGEDGATPYLVTELLTGGTLRAMLDDGAVLSPSQTIAVGLDGCRGLNYAHSEGFVHRDITPANLLFDADGRLRIADFGLAKAFAESGWTSQGTNLVGTARYASPEQASGHRLTAKSDVYSLGLILVEALSGSVPFSADTMLGTLTARVESDVPIPEAPEKLQDALRAMTQRDPDERPTAHEAGVMLLTAAQGLPRPRPLSLVGLPETPDPAPVSPTSNPDATRVDSGERDEIDRTQVAPARPNVEDEDHVRRWPWLLITVAAVVAAVWFGYQQLLNAEPDSIAVPDVAGMTEEEALTTFGDNFVLDEKLERTVDFDAGQITRTDPAIGEMVEEGATVSYWISLGRPLVRVPVADLVGRRQEQAIATIEALNLTVGNIDEVNSEDVGVGNVISVETTSAELQQGEPVNLIVSAGPQARVIPEFGPGSDIATYISTLETAGLAVAQSRAFDDEVPLDQFITITPAPGAAIERGDTVSVVISDGPFPVTLPESAGLDLGDVLDRLEAVGLLAGELLGSGNARCSVVGTDPPAGTEIQPGNAVAIVLSDCGEGEDA